MRITELERKAILKIARDVFGEKTRVYLFGSRVDDTKRGGDIDLFIEPENREDTLERKIDFKVRLKLEIEDQKIDVVVADSSGTPIELEARKTGIEL